MQAGRSEDEKEDGAKFPSEVGECSPETSKKREYSAGSLGVVAEKEGDKTEDAHYEEGMEVALLEKTLQKPSLRSEVRPLAEDIALNNNGHLGPPADGCQVATDAWIPECPPGYLSHALTCPS